MASPSSWLSTIGGAPTPLFGFLRAVGSMEGSQQEIEMADRPGVDGFFVWLKGLKCKPFQLTTDVDFTSKANALAGYVSACGYVGTKLVLYRYGASLGQVVVLGVTQESIQPANAAINGTTITTGASGFILTLNWSLRGVS